VVFYFWNFNQKLEQEIQAKNSIGISLNDKLSSLTKVKNEFLNVIPLINQIDPNLPGITLSALDVKLSELNEDLINADYYQATLLIREIREISQEILTTQTEIAKAEVTRIVTAVEDNLKEIDLLIGNVAIVTTDQLSALKDETQPIMERLSTARNYQELTVAEIRKRTAEIGEAQKQIVVRLGAKTLTMYENGNEIYVMPISAGRADHATRTGDFAILDKLGTVWGYWQIWLPQWMGIYYAGASENGIHGLPYDRAGRLYWKNDIGKNHVTYGCVMPNDTDMTKLYNWAEVGVPVTIIN
jgi:lipoprotein-anchoring transpeptidase ErfK/SrfK